MDAFFASIEQRDHPELRGKPVVVGGDSERGVIAAASYEARKYGIRSAMSSRIAKKKCPDLVFAPHRMGVYQQVSREIMSIFHEYTELVEPLSFDEAFLDVTRDKKNIGSATLIAKEIKKQIKTELNLVASAGVSYNKFLAKIASDYDKPDGLFVIKPNKAIEFISNLPIEKFFGVGKVTATKMHKNGVHFGRDLKKLSKNEANFLFGQQGRFFYEIVRGIDEREVKPNRIRKSIGAERTFPTDLTSHDDIYAALINVSQRLYERVLRSKRYGTTLTLKVKFSDFNVINRSKTIEKKIYKLKDIQELAIELLEISDYAQKRIRLLGLSVSNLDKKLISKPIQLKIPFVYY